jgi:hypothetical protein
MRDHVAKVLCDAAGRSVNGQACSICDRGLCTYWRSFLDEADAAIGAVRDFARLDRRNKPKSEYKFTADRWVA